MAYKPAATAHAVAVLLSTEDAEDITAPVSTVDHGSRHLLMRLTMTRNPTYLRIAWEYRFADALPGRLDEHAQASGPYAKRLGKSARDSRIHATAYVHET